MQTRPQIDFTRAFNAPRDLVYRAFTDPDQFTAWWGPSGNMVPRDEIDFDIRTGGYQRWTEVASADPTVRVTVHVDLDDVAHGRLLAGVMHVNGTRRTGSLRSRQPSASTSTTNHPPGLDCTFASGCRRTSPSQANRAGSKPSPSSTTPWRRPTPQPSTKGTEHVKAVLCHEHVS